MGKEWNIAIAALATIPPQQLKLKVNLLKEGENKISDLDLDLNSIDGIISTSSYIGTIEKAFYKLSCMNKSNDQVLQSLIKHLDGKDPFIRSQAAKIACLFPPSQILVTTLINQINKEQDSNTKIELITAIGYMGEEAKSTIPIIKKLSEDSNPKISRRSLTALAKILGDKQEIEECKEMALKLCKDLEVSDSVEDKKEIIIALQSLKINHQGIENKLIYLLNDEDKDVRLQAGKTLELLKKN